MPSFISRTCDAVGSREQCDSGRALEVALTQFFNMLGPDPAAATENLNAHIQPGLTGRRIIFGRYYIDKAPIGLFKHARVGMGAQRPRPPITIGFQGPSRLLSQCMHNRQYGLTIIRIQAFDRVLEANPSLSSVQDAVLDPWAKTNPDG